MSFETELNSSQKNLNKLYKDSLEKNKLLKIDIDNYYKKTNTDERKVYYEIEEITNIKYYNKLIKFLYITIFIIFLFRQRTNIHIFKRPLYLFFIILYISFPFLVKKIIIFVYSFINKNTNLTNSNSTIGNNQSLSTCYINKDVLEQQDIGASESIKDTELPELLVPKCYVRLEGGKCKNRKDSEWSGWKQLNFFNDCAECNDDTQNGCDAIKNKWSNYCGNNTFNIFTSASPESNNTLPPNNICISN